MDFSIANYVICFVMSGVSTYFLTKLVIVISKKLSFYDQPKKRKFHLKPTPLLGGLALIISIVINIFVFSTIVPKLFLFGVLGACLMFFLGLIDDKTPLKPYIKIVVQIMIISLLFINGIRIDYLTFPGNLSPLFFNSTMAFFMTQLWMLTVINMFNIIDGIDGLAVGTSCLTAIILFFVSLSVSPLFISFLLLTIAGSTAVFLRFNFYPAKIFLGDSGSLLLGYLFAFISVVGVLKSTVSCMILLFVFAIPMMDLILSVIRRLSKKKNIFYPDLEHIHHQLVRRGMSVPKATLVLYSITGIFGLLAVVGSVNSSIIKIAVGIFLFALVLSYFLVLQMSTKRFNEVKQKKRTQK